MQPVGNTGRETDEKNDNNSLVKKYLLIYHQSTDRGDELELRFGTNYRNPIIKIKFNKVIRISYVSINTIM